MIAETICAAVSAAGVGIAAVTAYRRRFLAAARILAYALVPVALVMTGLVKWAANTAFSPVAWLGFGVLALAWVLFMTTRLIERRGGRTRKERKEAARAARQGAVEPAASVPSLGPGAKPVARPGAKGTAVEPADDFSDIEAILKKHGI
ncbi:MFS transporter [Streptomyces sp. GMY02]|uniref:MFS transporter n=1 Tax=Streptomyces sp. GMY02 TaxID=1333528 RepID=UPI001C2C3004|nr:MFS transporter [Streptomyces sp. GMY02]QXE37814.1 MFS transporter [Streptomyces sp. GMY02]